MKKITLSGFSKFFTSRDLSFDSGFKFDFSKEKPNEANSNNLSTHSGINSLILLLVLFLFSNFLSAQIITIDGDTGDWSSNPSVKHVQDPFGNGVVDNQFTEGSKDFFFAADLRWAIGQTKAKNDIANAGFAIAKQVKYVDANSTVQTVDGTFLVFAGDRTSNNGDAQIGFWFYLNATAPTEVNGQRYFTPAHSRGDLLVLSDFTGGGRLGTVKVYRWIGGGVVSDGSEIVPNTDGNLETTDIQSFVAENNEGTPDVPTGWNFISGKYEINEFYEGFVNLGTIGGNTNFICSSTVLLETRSSQSITASLDDFVGSTLGDVPTVALNSTAISCAGESTTITATPDPEGTYTYDWTVPQGVTAPANTVSSFSTAVAGNYSVIVTNESGCSSSAVSVTVTQPELLEASSTKVDVACNGGSTGSVDATVSGGTAPYTYLWSNEATTEDLSAVAAGTYSLTVTDANGCTATTSKIVGEPDLLVASSTKVDVTCYGESDGSVDATVLGGKTPYSYSWSNEAITEDLSDVTVGTYSLTVTDANGCTAKTEIIVGEPTAVDLTATGTTFCYGEKGEITFSAEGGTGTKTYTVNGEVATSPFEVSAAGIYTIEATDENQCYDTKEVEVIVNPLPEIVCIESVTTSVLCGVTLATAQENTNQEFSEWLASFNYDATIYDLATSYSYNTLAATPAVSGDTPLIPLFGAVASTTVKWTLTNKVTGCKNSCESTFTVDNSCKIACSSDKTDVLCEGTKTGSITVSADGGAAPYSVYLFKEGSTTPDFSKTGIATSTFSATFENLAAGNYTYEVRDVNYDITNEVCNQELPIQVGKGIPCGEPHATYTQGYYGNLGGTSCADGASYTTTGLIAKALASYPLGTMTIGLPGKSVLISNTTADITGIIKTLPGGGTSKVLLAGNPNISALPTSYLKKGDTTITNTLLAQTITLGLNLGIDSKLGAFVLQVGKLAIAEPQAGCGSTTPKIRACSLDLYTPTVNEYKYYDLPAVVGLLPTKTVQGLFDMANNALGGGVLPAGITLTNLAAAVDLINNAFDGYKIAMGYDQTPLTCVADRAAFEASPVPVTSSVTVTYKFSYVSNVTIEVWNLSGVKLYTQADSNSYLNKQVIVNYPFTTAGSYIVKINTNIGSSSRTIIKN